MHGPKIDECSLHDQCGIDGSLRGIRDVGFVLEKGERTIHRGFLDSRAAVRLAQSWCD